MLLLVPCKHRSRYVHYTANLFENNVTFTKKRNLIIFWLTVVMKTCASECKIKIITRNGN